MSISLPHAVNYVEQLPALPDQSQVINVAVNPTNSSSFTSGSQIQFDLISRGFLIPDSMYISYSLTQTVTKTATMRGCPVYSAFNRVDVQCGSQNIDSIQNYNILMNMLSNLTLSVSEKYGLQSAYGYGPSTAAIGTNLDDLDGRLFNTDFTETGSYSAPLMTVLSNSEKLIPLFAMPQIRINLTLDTIANIFTTTNVPTDYTLSNVELRYKVIDFGGEVENMIRSMGSKIFIKSQSFGVSSQTLASGTSGSQDLVFNQRYASCKAIFAINGMSTTTGNMAFSSCNLAAGSSYSFNIAGVQYPQKRINTGLNKAQQLMELKSATGSIFDRNNSFSINAIEQSFDAVDGADTYVSPGKHYIGTSLEKLNSDSLLTGISTQNSPITYHIDLGGATAASSNITLVINHDSIWEIDLVNRDVVLRN